MSSYEEKLPTGGQLCVRNFGWYIFYFCWGPDRRYKPRSYTIDARNIDNYIRAVENNCQKYLQLKRTANNDSSELTIDGEMGMKIRVGGYFDGVWLFDTDVGISGRSYDYDYNHRKSKEEKDREDLEKFKNTYTQLIKDFKYCKVKGPEMLEKLKSMK